MILRWLKSLFAQDQTVSIKTELSGNESSVSFEEEQTEQGGAMWLFVGLGNPGSKYAQNRHNVGFMAIDKIADVAGMSDKFRKKFQGEFVEGNAFGSKILLLKPQTYMNNSGQAVAAAVQFYKLNPQNIVVFHDEIDIEPHTVRIKKGGGSAGHNGLKSIQAHLGTPEYWRVRIGIGRSPHGKDVSDYVLDNFSREEAIWVEPLLSYMSEHIREFIDNDPKAYEKNISDYIQKTK